MKAKGRKPAKKKALRRRKINLRAVADEGLERELIEGSSRLYRPVKKPVTLRLDADVLQWFKTQGRGYQTRINLALRGLMRKEQKANR